MSNNPFKTWIRDNQQPWHWDALCTTIGGDVWFPESGQSVTPARRICNRCPVATQCLKEALDSGEKYGVWGGKSERERHHMVKGSAA